MWMNYVAKITLLAWSAKHYDPPKPIGTVRRWQRLGLIFPPPEKHGRDYRVEPDARYIPPDDPVMGDIIHGTKSKKARESATAR